MKTWPRWVCFAVLCAACWLLPAPARGQAVAPLVAEVEVGGAARGWWVEAGGEPSGTLAAVLESARGAGVPTLALGPSRPAISRVYRVPKLTSTNAANLGVVLGASHVLTGTLTHEAPPGVEVLGLHRHRIMALLLLGGVKGSTGHLAVTIQREGQGATPEAARAAAERDLVAAAGPALGRAWREVAGPVGLRRPEPWVVLVGAPSWARVEEAQRALGALPGVKGTRIGWASAGLIALDINPDAEDTPEAVEGFARGLGEALRVQPAPLQDGLIVVQGL